jgi:hypothetical protein
MLKHPPTFLLLAQEFLEVRTRNSRDKLTCLRGCAKNRNYGTPPGSHKGVTIVEDTGNPSFGRVLQSSPSDHGMYV